MTRPELTLAIPLDDFQAFYWLKCELLEFCRAHHLGTTGSKQELSERIARFLASGARAAPTASRHTANAAMPTTFSRQSIIGPRWRCSQALRGFFIQEIGPQFHFDQTMRTLIKDGHGKTLADVITIWETAHRTVEPKDIAPQFEYNRHMRAFFLANPGATLQDAIAAWNELKAQRKPAEHREV